MLSVAGTGGVGEGEGLSSMVGLSYSLKMEDCKREKELKTRWKGLYYQPSEAIIGLTAQRGKMRLYYIACVDYQTHTRRSHYYVY